MQTILEFFFNKTLKVTNSFRNEFSIKNHVEVKYYALLVVYRFKSLYVSQMLMAIDLLPIKHQMTAILDLFFNETIKVTTSFGNKFSVENHVEMRYYIKIYVK